MDPETQSPGGCGGRRLCSREAGPQWAVWHGLQMYCDPVGEASSCPGRGENALQAAEGPGKSGSPRCLPELEVTFRLECFSSLVPFP